MWLLGILTVLAIVLLGALLAVALRIFFHSELTAIRLARENRDREWVCLRCHDCCRKTVLLSAEDCRRLMEFTGEPVRNFASSLGRVHWLRRMTAGNCIFHRGGESEISSCAVYPARPEACRRFPHLRYFGRPALDPRCRAVQLHNSQDNKS